MKNYVDEYKDLAIITSPNTIPVDLPIKINESLKHDIKFIVSCNKSLVENKIRKRLANNYMGVNMCMNIKKELSYLLESLNYL